MNRTTSWLSAGLLVVSLALQACGGPLRYTPRPTARAPEADTRIEAQVNPSQANTQVTIHMDHLAPPDRIQERSTAYVCLGSS